MGMRLSRRGVSELIGAIFAIMVVIALIFLIVYMFDSMKKLGERLESRYGFERMLLRSRINVANFTLGDSGSVSLLVLKLYPGLASYVRTVSCTFQIGSSTQRVVRCEYFVNNSDTLTIVLNNSVSWSSARIALVLRTGDVVIVPVYSTAPVVYEVPAPGVDYAEYVNETYRGTLLASTVFYNNSTGWACFNATLNFTCYSSSTCTLNGSSYVVVSKVFCVDPLATYIISNLFTVYCAVAPCSINVNVTFYTLSGREYSFVIPVMRIYQ